MKIQFLQVNDLFDKDFKSYAAFLEAIYQKKRVSIFCSSIAKIINIMRILSVQVAVIIP